MAERRMFAKTIIDSDAFLDLPISAQALYFHLSMRADDEGFINKPRAIMNMIGAKNDDMKLLVDKKFVIYFESGVIVIKHWKIHNYIQPNRLKETKYKFEKASLYLDENNAYSTTPQECGQNDSKLLAECGQSDGKVSREVRLGKDSVGKDNTTGGSNAHTREEEPENDLGRVMDFFMDRINPTPSPMAVDFLKGYTETLGADVVLHALGIALGERKTGWSYIHAILQRYERDGLTSMDAVLRSETDRAEKKEMKTEKPQKPNQITGSVKSRFTGDELNALLAGLDRI